MLHDGKSSFQRVCQANVEALSTDAWPCPISVLEVTALSRGRADLKNTLHMHLHSGLEYISLLDPTRDKGVKQLLNYFSERACYSSKH